jgi:hypothetical protein
MATFRGTGKSCSSSISKEHNTITSRIWLRCGVDHETLRFSIASQTYGTSIIPLKRYIFTMPKKIKMSSLTMNVQCIHGIRFVEKASVHC